MFLCAPLLINLIASIPNRHVVGDPNSTEATWIGFLGDYVGGFLSTLIGAGITGLVAYYLIGKEVSESVRQQTINTFFLDFNTDFQKVKNDVIGSTTNMQAILQNYYTNLSDKITFIAQYDKEMDRIKQIQMEFTSLINKHVISLSYIKDQKDGFAFNLVAKQFATVGLFYNDMRNQYVENSGNVYNIIADYNSNGVPLINDHRNELLKNEKIIISVLFPVFSNERDFKLPGLFPIEETSYEDMMRRYREQL